MVHGRNTLYSQFGVTMTHEDRGHYAQKHPSDTKINPTIADAVKAVNVIHSAFYLSHRVSNVFIVGTGIGIPTTIIHSSKLFG